MYAAQLNGKYQLLFFVCLFLKVTFNVIIFRLLWQYWGVNTRWRTGAAAGRKLIAQTNDLPERLQSGSLSGRSRPLTLLLL